MSRLLVPALIAIGTVGFFYVSRDKSRFLGDKAIVQDEVQVPSMLFKGLIPDGSPLPLGGEISAVVRIDRVSPDNIIGAVVGYVAPASNAHFPPLPPPLNAVTAPRSSITSISRQGRMVT